MSRGCFFLNVVACRPVPTGYNSNNFTFIVDRKLVKLFHISGGRVCVKSQLQPLTKYWWKHIIAVVTKMSYSFWWLSRLYTNLLPSVSTQPGAPWPLSLLYYCIKPGQKQRGNKTWEEMWTEIGMRGIPRKYLVNITSCRIDHQPSPGLFLIPL